ncbi:hypothetical protein [Mesorhizobium sp. Pch-S]|uniref:hypothetical protein n=1 Tax=Mesorhizobium sp. Pch-S TaxID=2082387 RepID=UPI00101182CE|nr:hypothetical protein [Mesorhizobium sp. Pch-S]QAZ46800.1 hypothetical protein C1M53_31605 [Mesorhizobium sp. Pch-S]
MVDRYHITGWNNEQIETQAEDGEWVRYADHVSALTASASEPMTEQERHLLLRMLSAFEQSHVGQKASVELAHELRAANRLIARLTAASPVPASEPEPVAFRVVAEPNLPWSFYRKREEAEQAAKNLLMYRKGCTSARVEPLYANPVPTPPLDVNELPSGATQPSLTIANYSQATPDGAVKACQICGGPHDNDMLSDICQDCESSAPWRNDALSAALETPWQKPGRAAQAQAGEKPDFPADEQSGETSHGAAGFEAAWSNWWKDIEPSRYSMKEGIASDAFRAGWEAAHPADGWRKLHGPYGYPIKPHGLNEEHWFLALQPSSAKDETSVPLFTKDEQALGPAAPAAKPEGE